ncbi:hypothetical protein KTS45_09645 [Halomicroarcula limicola]|uniref:Alpha-L-glutamate ligase-related protein ATP-grasp domain-containing protein n=1 Tax=Haloarcula limicola TaxID=1429915 RepID=A0A8J8C3G1_9EURY|nr:sugar-transfer associated ATP-grasp domain-containing protein [Halomicroarcula limicola]MBV0924461.1 hypothetical protein [Halomicroarcula limicola]
MSSESTSLATRAIKRSFHGVKSAYQSLSTRINATLAMAKIELKTGRGVSIPMSRRLWLWRRGFTSRFDGLFDVTEENYDQYLSDYQEFRSYDINEPWKDEMDNKLTAHLLMLPFEEHLPTLFGVLEGGEVRRHPAYEGESETPALDDAETIEHFERYDARTYVDTLLEEEEAVVLKPLLGSGGLGVYVVRADDTSNGYSINGSTYTEERFDSLLDDLEMYMVTEFSEQSAFLDELFPGSANTIRVVTMWDYEADEPFIAWAHLRVGTEESAPLDNLSQGGIQAGIDIDTGEMRYAAKIGDKSPPIGVDWYDEHPTTGARLAGRTVPNWEAVADGITEMAEAYPQFPYVGWDVLLTDDGFEILELNSSPGMINTQIESKVLDEPRVRRFYEHHDVL